MDTIIIPDDRILATEEAIGTTGRTTGHSLKGVKKVLISEEYASEAGTRDVEWFRCTEAGCGKAFLGVQSAVSHRTTHSTRRAGAKLVAKQAASFKRRSDGIRAGNEARAARLAEIKNRKPADLLNEVADTLTTLAQQLRDAAKIFEAPAPLISEEEIAELRRKSDQLDDLRALLRNA